MSSNRKFDRTKQRLTLRFTLDGKTWESAFTTDVSPRGVFVMSSRPVPKGTSVRMEIQLPEVGMLTLTGVVAWKIAVPRTVSKVKRSGFGVELRGAPEAWFEFCAQIGAESE